MGAFKKFLTVCAYVIGAILFTVLIPAIPVGSTKNLAEGWGGDPGASIVYDAAGFLTNDDAEELAQIVRDTSEELEINIYIYVAGSEMRFYSDPDTETFAHDLYDETFGEYTDGVLYLLDNSGKSSPYDFISTSGKAILMYQEDINGIFNYLDMYLPKGGVLADSNDIFRTVEAFCSQLVTRAANDKSYYYDSYHKLYSYYKGDTFTVAKNKPYVLRFTIMLFMVVLGGLVGLITYVVTKSHYKFKTSANPSVYIAREKTRFTRRTDIQIRTHVSKVKIESSSGGGGSRGGGGGHSHGGSHGGGGHHR